MIFGGFLKGRIRESKMKRIQMDPDPQHCIKVNTTIAFKNLTT